MRIWGFFLFAFAFVTEKANELPRIRFQNLGIFLFAFAFVTEKANELPRLRFRIRLRDEHVGHAQATTQLRNYVQSQI